MPTYKYESKNTAGKVSTGVLSAPNLAAASQQLRARGEFILALQPADAGGGRAAGFSLTFGPPAGDLQNLTHHPPPPPAAPRGGGPPAFSLTSGPSARDIQNFTSQLAVMIRAGISLRAAIEGISEQATNPKFKTMLIQMKKDV